MNYEKSKFHYIGSSMIEKRTQYINGPDKIYYEEKRNFEFSWGYRRFLIKKKYEELKTEISILKSRLNREFKEYGKVDDIDYKLFLYYLEELEKYKNRYNIKD